MSLYLDYLAEIEDRKTQGLAPLPIDSGELTTEIISQIKDPANEHREQSLNFLIYNTLPGTTAAAGEKARFLEKIILGNETVAEISPTFAFELLSHMKGGASIKSLLNLALGENPDIAKQAGEVLKTQFFLYDADMERLESAFKSGNPVAKEILESYAAAEFFTKLPDVPEEVKIVTFIAGEGDISTDLLSPGNQAHSRSDRELHGKCMISPEAQNSHPGAPENPPRQERHAHRRKRHHGRRLLPHVRRQQRRPLDWQASLQIRPLRQLRPHRRRHQRHLTHLPHHR